VGLVFLVVFSAFRRLKQEKEGDGNYF